jgi:hypothetical protein
MIAFITNRFHFPLYPTKKWSSPVTLAGAIEITTSAQVRDCDALPGADRSA